MEKKNNLLAWLMCCLFWGAPAYAVDSVTIMADSSMSTAITALARSYAIENQVVVNTSFANEASQETQITEGSAADILITPRASWIDALKTKGLVDVYSQQTVARGRLALVGPEDSDLEVKSSDDFPTTALIQRMGWEPGFVIGYPETLPEGVYSKEAIDKLGASDDLEPYTLYVKQLDQMYDMVQKQENYGLFLYSNVLGRKGMKVLSVLPDSSHKPIEYYAVVIAGDNMGEARRFLAFLKSRKAAVLLSQYGFSA